MELQVVALPDRGEDAGEAAVWASRLLAELSELDDAEVDAVTLEAPNGAKGVGTAAGALLARIANLNALKALLEAVRSWATRTGRSVEVSIDGDTLKLSRASREQQDRVIEAWLVRHASVS